MAAGIIKKLSAEDRSYYVVSDVMSLLGISQAKAYDIRDALDEEQMEERARRFAEIRERVFGSHGE